MRRDDTDAPALPRLQGLTNLRDLGGHPTTDGRRVRTGRLYRSESLAFLTPDDHDAMVSLGIRAVCDFRGGLEGRPASSPIAGAAYHPMPIETRFEALTGGDPAALDAARMTRAMAAIYDAMPALAAPHLARLLELVLDDASVPLLFHCTAGKDRTGFAAAVLLRLLGVHAARIEADYLATNTAWRPLFTFPEHVPPDAAAVAFAARAEWLARSFAAIDAQHGGFDAYAGQALRLSPAARAALREGLTVAA